MPRDVLGQTADFNEPTKFQSIDAPTANDENLQKAVKLLSEAQKPVILVGAGIKNMD